MKINRMQRAAVVVASAAVALSSAAVPAAVSAQPASTAQGVAAKKALDAIDAGPNDAASVVDGIEAANAVLKKLGITPFTPTIGACTDGKFPLAVGGAIPGPTTPLLGSVPDIPLLGDVNAVKSGEVLYGFVPVGAFNDASDKKGMQVAWFNVGSMKGGMSPMGSFTSVIIDALVKRSGLPEVSFTGLKTLLDKTLPANGARGGIVDTDKGTVLSAIFGSVKNGDATCYFFPSLGIATVK